MILKDIIYLSTITVTVCISSFFVYWRENRKMFQEKIFEYKYLAYKEIAEEIGMYYQDVYSFLEVFQEFEGSEEDWELHAKIYFKEYFAKAFLLERLYFKNLALLPESQLIKLQALTSKCVSHVTAHSHIGTSMPHDSYSDLLDMLYDFIEEGRKDMSINIINSSLNKRLTDQFYPVNFKQLSNKKT